MHDYIFESSKEPVYSYCLIQILSSFNNFIVFSDNLMLIVVSLENNTAQFHLRITLHNSNMWHNCRF